MFVAVRPCLRRRSSREPLRLVGLRLTPSQRFVSPRRPQGTTALADSGVFLITFVPPPHLATTFEAPPRRGTAEIGCYHLHSAMHLSWGSLSNPHLRPTVSCPLPVSFPTFGQRLPHRRSRSALVVFHHFDGFLQQTGASLFRLAARWGSSRFRTGLHQKLPSECRYRPSPRCYHPSKNLSDG